MGQISASRSQNAVASAVAVAIPLILILFVFNGVELTQQPSALNPTGETYADGISLVAGTSATLVTIGLSIIGAEAVWLFKQRPAGLTVRLLAYAAFLMDLVSIYFGIKIASWSGLALASTDPSILPLLNFLGWQALLVLCAGLLISGLAIFSFLEQESRG